MSKIISKTPQNENSLVSSSILFVLMMVLFGGALYSLSFLSLSNPWPMAVCLGLFALAFWLPQTILGRSDSAGEN
jgi:VIT1/CCC1 family predicted Fe2+/Mn2+ transporter